MSDKEIVKEEGTTQDAGGHGRDRGKGELKEGTTQDAGGHGRDRGKGE